MPQNRMPSVAPPSNVLQSSFTAGELAPAIYARPDLAAYHVGAMIVRNFFIQPQGGAVNRAGTKFIDYALSQDSPTRLIPFVFSLTQQYVLEFGDRVMRFIFQGGYVTDAGNAVLHVATPYAAADLYLVKFAQSNDVMTLTHPNYPAQDLKRLSGTSWSLTPVSFAAHTLPPTGVTVTPHADTAAINAAGTAPAHQEFDYVVTAVALNPPDQSEPSANAACSNFGTGYYGQFGVYNQISWTAVPGADHYNIFLKYQGVYGFVGSTSDLTFKDQGVLPLVTQTPPQHTDPFDAGTNNPSVSTYFQQRRWFGGSLQDPGTLWATKTGNYSNMDRSVPVQADDSITAAIAALQDNTIQHIVAAQDLLVFTSGGTFKVSGGNSADAITPAQIVVAPQVNMGCSPECPPILINRNLLYVQAIGGHVEDLKYNLFAQNYEGRDLSNLSQHLFIGYQISSWAYAHAPYRLIWMVRSDGTLLSLTYLETEAVQAWARHDTLNGQFLGVTTIVEPNGFGALESFVYLVVRRTLGGRSVQTIERMQTRQLGVGNLDQTVAWIVDCGLQYNGVPTTVISGLDHLDGETVAILADGSVQPQQIVQGGHITLDQPCSLVTVGLPIQAQLQTMPLDAGSPTDFGKRKRISRIRVFMHNTRGLKAGAVNLDTGATPRLTEFKERSNEAWGSPTALKTGSEFVNAWGNYDVYGSLLVQADSPLPATILAIEPDFEIGT